MSTTVGYDQKAAEIIAAYEKATLSFEGAVQGVEVEIVKNNGFDTSVDEDAWKDALRQSARTSIAAAVVHTKDERAKTGLSRPDLFNKTLPTHPQYQAANAIEIEAMTRLERLLWGITQTTPGAYVQKSLADGLVLVQADVRRGNDPVRVVFVTANVEVIMADLLQPEIDNLVQKSARLGAAATLIATRHPELVESTVRAIKAGNRKVSAASQPSVPLPALPCSTDEEA